MSTIYFIASYQKKIAQRQINNSVFREMGQFSVTNHNAVVALNSFHCFLHLSPILFPNTDLNGDLFFVGDLQNEVGTALHSVVGQRSGPGSDKLPTEMHCGGVFQKLSHPCVKRGLFSDNPQKGHPDSWRHEKIF